MRLFYVAAAFCGAVAVPAPAVAAGGCETAASLFGATTECVETGTETTSTSAPVSTSTTVYKTQIRCTSAGDDAVCNNPLTCENPPGSVLYSVLRSTDGGVTFVPSGEVCLTNPPPTTAVQVLTPAMVATAFQGLRWPESPLEVQPPGGRTLVNLETNFFTSNTGAQTQVVTLLEQQVEIEATPTSWTWHHGDGTTQTTTDPGRAYPALDITHVYTDAETTVSPSVDTTYSGRYRVAGGPWTAIPATVTVAGTPGQLEVVPARPQLVGGG